MPTAYHEIMEPIILILLLAVMGKDSSELKDSLLSALKLYRENRELITLLSQLSKGGSEAESAPQSGQEKGGEKGGEVRQPEAQQKSRSEETGSYRLIDEFLKTHSV